MEINRLVISLLSVLVLVFSGEARSVVSNLKNLKWLRLEDGVSNLKIDPKNRYIAFQKSKSGVFLLDIKSREQYLVSQGVYADGSFFWAPDGNKLFFVEKRRVKDGVVAKLFSYDTYLKKALFVEELNSNTSFLSFDPKTLRLSFLKEQGEVATRILRYTGSKLAKWQTINQKNHHFWLATKKKILLIDASGKKIKSLLGGAKEEVETFDISPDGSKIAWSTSGNKIFYGQQDGSSHFVAYGSDPKWHPNKSILVYSGARMMGNAIRGFDLCIYMLSGQYQWLTLTPYSNERWPFWLKGKIVFTVDNTTDLFVYKSPEMN